MVMIEMVHALQFFVVNSWEAVLFVVLVKL